MSEEQVESAVNEQYNPNLFDEQEQAVISFATQLTNQVQVADETIEQLKSFLSDSQIVELAATVGLANFTNRVNEGLAIELP